MICDRFSFFESFKSCPVINRASSLSTWMRISDKLNSNQFIFITCNKFSITSYCLSSSSLSFAAIFIIHSQFTCTIEQKRLPFILHLLIMDDNITLIISLSHHYTSYINSSMTTTSSTDTFNTSTGSKKWRDIIDPQLLDYIPDLWLNYEPPTKYQHYTLAITYLLILLPAIFGNSAIIWLFYRCRNLRTPSNILVVNLAIADLIQNLKMPVFIYNSFKCGPAMGELGCQIYGFFGGLSGTSAIMTIAMMAIERLNSISSPLNPYSRFSMRRAIIISLLIWIYSFIFSTPPVFHMFNRYVPEGYLTSCSFDYLSTKLESRIFILAFFTAAWLVPLVMIILSYAGIIYAVRRNENAFKTTQKVLQYSSLYRGSQRRHGKNGANTEMRLVKVVLCLILLWLVSWTPYAIVALLGLVDQSYISPTSSMIPALFAKMSSIVNPYLYGLANPRFKRELRRKITVFCWRPKTESLRFTTQTRNLTSTQDESHFVRISREDLTAINLAEFELKAKI